jgi:putative transposase
VLVSRSSSLYRRHRFPVEIINYCVRLYYRSSLSCRDIEGLMAQRGVRVSYESIRHSGGARRSSSGRKSPMSCVAVGLDPGTSGTSTRRTSRSMDGPTTTLHLWRAVDQEGVVLDVLVRGRRDKEAAI